MPSHLAGPAQMRDHNFYLVWLIYWLPVAGWAGVIFSLSSVPGTGLPSLFPFQDKIAHLIVYFILGVLILRALNRTNPALSYAERYAFTFFAVLFYGITDEAHQLNVYLRDCSFWDACADAVGGLFAIIFFQMRLRLLKTTFKGVGSRE